LNSLIVIGERVKLEFNTYDNKGRDGGKSLSESLLNLPEELGQLFNVKVQAASNLHSRAKCGAVLGHNSVALLEKTPVLLLVGRMHEVNAYIIRLDAVKKFNKVVPVAYILEFVRRSKIILHSEIATQGLGVCVILRWLVR
jgi:hypothetical protein